MPYDVAHAQLASRECESQPLDLIPGFLTLVQGTYQMDLEWELPCPVAGTTCRFLPVLLTDYFQLEAATVPPQRAR